MEELIFGAGIGLASGLTPGPLLTLVVATTLERGFGAGARVALSPLVTDVVMIALTVFVMRRLPDVALSAMGLVGGGVVIALGVRTALGARTARLPGGKRPTVASRDLWKGAAVNLLNPNAWLFWTSVGAPLLVRSWSTRPAGAMGFVAGFVTLLVGTKLTLAALLAKGRGRLTDRGYRIAIGACSLLLFGLGAMLVVRALQAAGGG